MRARWRLAVAAGLVVFAVCAASEQQPVRVGLTAKLFWLEGARETLAQTQLIADKVGPEIGRSVKVQEAKEKGPGALADALAAGSYDFVLTDGLGYVRLRREFQRRARLSGGEPRTLCRIAGLCIPPNPDEDEAAAGTVNALILTRMDPALSTLADLRGKRFVYGPLSEDDCSMLFLEGLLRKLGAKSKEEFFGSVNRLSCEDACFIALLRGTADVTCVSEEKRKAKEMVIGGEMKLQTVESSRPYAAYVYFCLEGQVDPQLASRMRAELMVFHETAEGRGLLSPFKVKRFSPLSADSIAVIEEMIQAAEPAADRERAEPGRAGAPGS